MPEQMICRLSLQHEVQDLRTAEAFVEDAHRRVMRDKDIQISRNILVGDAAIAGNGADYNSVKLIHCILKENNTAFCKERSDGIRSVDIKGEFVIAGDKDLVLAWLSGKPIQKVIILSSFHVILDSIAGADKNIGVSRYLQLPMLPVSVSEGENLLSFKVNRCHICLSIGWQCSGILPSAAPVPAPLC